MRLSIQLVTWNGTKYITHLFASLKSQINQDWQLMILDNGSIDDTVEIIKKELNNFGVQHQLIVNAVNTGFAGGHNQLWRESDAEYVLLLNQDLYLAPECIGKLIRALDDFGAAAAVAPRLMRWQFPDQLTNTIDTIGLMVSRQRRVVEYLSAQLWDDQTRHFLISSFPHFPYVEVFGVSGAMMMLRRSLVEDAALNNGEIFDVTYGSYKEDVDLAFRLRARGYRSLVALDAVAYHDRTVGSPTAPTDRAASQNKISQPPTARRQSYRNHLLTLYKNEYGQNFLLDWPWILWYERSEERRVGDERRSRWSPSH